MRAIVYTETGGPEVLTYEDIDVGAPSPGQIRIKQHACGINFIDVYFRIGMYPAPLPFVIGNEGAGGVVAIGEGVKDFKVGDRVAYVAGPGSYTAERLLPADRAVKLPDAISYEQAAGMMLKGMTAQYLVRPDGHVGYRSGGTDVTGLARYLSRWLPRIEGVTC